MNFPRKTSTSIINSSLFSFKNLALALCLLASSCDKGDQKPEKSLDTQDSFFETANVKNISDTITVDGATCIIDVVSPSLLTKENSSQCGRKPSN